MCTLYHRWLWNRPWRRTFFFIFKCGIQMALDHHVSTLVLVILIATDFQLLKVNKSNCQCMRYYILKGGLRRLINLIQSICIIHFVTHECASYLKCLICIYMHKYIAYCQIYEGKSFEWNSVFNVNVIKIALVDTLRPAKILPNIQTSYTNASLSIEAALIWFLINWI